MRVLQPELLARLQSGATRLCRCWSITRRDGVRLGFTDHDEDLEIDGLVYKAGTGMDASALQSATGLNVDNAEASGALSSTAIAEQDIRHGKYDGATVHQWIVDWERTSLRVLLFRGTFGEIRRNDAVFEVELRSETERLNLPVGRSILRQCDRVLGDGKCRVDLSKPAFSAEASTSKGSTGNRVVASGLRAFAQGWFTLGTLVWISGANAGESAAIKSDTRDADGGRVFDLWRHPNAEIEPGDRFRVSAGCDKGAETCRRKFDNFLNFRGFPHIPGQDWVTAYPKEGAIHDGQSRG